MRIRVDESKAREPRNASQAEISRARTRAHSCESDETTQPDCRSRALHVQPRSLSRLLQAARTDACKRARTRDDTLGRVKDSKGTRTRQRIRILSRIGRDEANGRDESQARARENARQGKSATGALERVQPTINKREDRKYRQERCLRRETVCHVVFLSSFT